MSSDPGPSFYSLKLTALKLYNEGLTKLVLTLNSQAFDCSVTSLKLSQFCVEKLTYQKILVIQHDTAVLEEYMTY